LQYKHFEKKLDLSKQKLSKFLPKENSAGANSKWATKIVSA